MSPNVPYTVAANWTSYRNRATNARYEVVYESESGQLIEEQFTVDQTTGGGQWQELGRVVPSSSSLSVTLSNDADGYVIADAVKLQAASASDESIRIESDKSRAYVVEGLAPGEWEFEIRAVDTSGAASDYSEPRVRVID